MLTGQPRNAFFVPVKTIFFEVRTAAGTNSAVGLAAPHGADAVLGLEPAPWRPARNGFACDRDIRGIGEMHAWWESERHPARDM